MGMRMKEFIFECKNWPSINDWANKHHMVQTRLHNKWLGTSRNKWTWRGAAGEIFAQWKNAGKPRFDGKVRVGCVMHFNTPGGAGRDPTNYVPKWLLDLIHLKPDIKVHFDIIRNDNQKFCEVPPVKLIENADRNYTIVRIQEVE